MSEERERGGGKGEAKSISWVSFVSFRKKSTQWQPIQCESPKWLGSLFVDRTKKININFFLSKRSMSLSQSQRRSASLVFWESRRREARKRETTFHSTLHFLSSPAHQLFILLPPLMLEPSSFQSILTSVVDWLDHWQDASGSDPLKGTRRRDQKIETRR